MGGVGSPLDWTPTRLDASGAGRGKPRGLPALKNRAVGGGCARACNTGRREFFALRGRGGAEDNSGNAYGLKKFKTVDNTAQGRAAARRTAGTATDSKRAPKHAPQKRSPQTGRRRAKNQMATAAT